MIIFFFVSFLKNGPHNIPNPKVTFSHVLFCPTKRPKPKGFQFIVTCDKEKQQVLTLKHLKPEIL